MSYFRTEKAISGLPSPLVADTLYFVRSGEGYQEYLTDTTGSIAYKPNVPDVADTIIYVKAASQLAGTLSSDVLYYIDGNIDMGATSIVVPEGGLNISGSGQSASSLKSTEDDFDLFVTGTGDYAGELFLNKITVNITGANSNVMVLDNQRNLDNLTFVSVAFLNCTKLGDVSNYRQGFSDSTSFISCVDGLTMNGTWEGGWALVNSVGVGSAMSGSLFKEGSNLTINGSFRSNANILKLNASGGSFCDFSPSNITLDAGFSLLNVRSDPNIDSLPNMPATSIKSLIRDCVGIDNTYVGATHQPQADSVVVVDTIDTLIQVTGVMDLNEPYWFSTANTNGLQLDSTQNIRARVNGTMSFSGGSNTAIGIQIRKFKSSDSSYVNVGPEYVTAFSTSAVLGTLASNVSFSGTTDMVKNDRIEIWVKNKTNTDNITLKAGGQFEVIEK